VEGSRNNDWYLPAVKEAQALTVDPLTPRSLLRLAAFMGVAGFGGGMAVIAMVRRQLVDRTRALSDGEFLRVLALAQSLPGGIAINLFTQLGFRSGGVTSALLCTVAFVLPSALIMGVLGAIYPTLEHIPRLAAVFASLDACVLAVIAAAAIQIGRRMTRWSDFVIAAGVALAVSLRLLTVLEAVLLVTLGALAVSAWRGRQAAGVLPMFLLLPASKAPLLLSGLALVFLQIGVSLFGGGLAMIPMLDRLLVGRGLLSTREFEDAITFSQLTPGPVATACTFVGYRLAGVAGSLVATVSVFTPPFVLSVLAARSVERFQDSRALRTILAGLGPASVGLIAAAAVSLGRGALHGLEPWGFAVACLFFLLVFDAPPLLVLVVAGTLRAIATIWSH
jgi:chromate transporter